VFAVLNEGSRARAGVGAVELCRSCADGPRVLRGGTTRRRGGSGLILLHATISSRIYQRGVL